MLSDLPFNVIFNVISWKFKR